jgi:hypothetical protein
MSENKIEEKKYFERLNISVSSIADIKDLIMGNIMDTMNAWEQGLNVKKQTFRIIGPAGVGKTDICRQMSDELTKLTGKKFGMIMIKAPVLSRDDFIIPFPVVSGGSHSFKMLYSDFVPKGDDTYGLFVVDEFSRGDHALQQLLWQAMEEYAIHLHAFPKGWFVIAADNPDDSEYQMDMMEDAAGLRRQLHIYTEPRAKPFLDYAISSDFHPLVIEFIQTHPGFVYDYESQKVGMVFANPSSWEKVSDHLKKVDLNGGVKPRMDEVEALCTGLLNVNMTRLFMEFVMEQKDINPKHIFHDWKRVKKDVQALIKESNQAKLGKLMVSFCTYMTTSMPEYGPDNLENVEEFLLMMPIDTAALFINQVDGFKRESKEFIYMTKIHLTLLKKSKKYKTEFYDAIVNVGRD